MLVLLDFPSLKAAIFFDCVMHPKRTYLIGFSKYKKILPGNKQQVLIAHYTANLFCFENKLCYHKVKAANLEDAKKMVKQRHHLVKNDPKNNQPVCAHGMSFYQVKNHSDKHLATLLYVSSQRISRHRQGDIVSNQHMSKKFKSYKIKSYRIC